MSFVFLPGLHIEELPAEIGRHKPDILHISAHGSGEQLSLMNEGKTRIGLDADTLLAFLNPERLPRLIYLNACDSGPIARALAGTVPMAIGSTAPITNRAARAAAVAFYQRILTGSRVTPAFRLAQKMIEAMQSKQASAEIHHRPDVNPDTEVLYRVPRILAGFEGSDPAPGRKRYNVRFGLTGCPANTIQVVFFTDDGSRLDDASVLSEELCVVARGSPVRGAVWTDGDDKWEVDGDFRLFAVGVTGDGGSFSVGTTLCEAIKTRYLERGDGVIPDVVATILAQLRSRDGSEIDDPLKPGKPHGGKPLERKPQS